MLTHTLIHPRIIGSLAAAGHGSQVLIADANFPHATAVNPAAELVYLNLVPGELSAVTVLRALCSAVRFEAAAVMSTADGGRPPAADEYAAMLPGVPLDQLPRERFYDAACGRSVALAIATGEQRLYANILLTIAALPPAPGPAGAPAAGPR